jgi:hypothetical protein
MVLADWLSLFILPRPIEGVSKVARIFNVSSKRLYLVNPFRTYATNQSVDN